MSKTCGGCQHWQKVRADGEAFGICQTQDLRCPSDYGCPDHKRIPYRRVKCTKNTLTSEQLDM